MGWFRSRSAGPPGEALPPALPGDGPPAPAAPVAPALEPLVASAAPTTPAAVTGSRQPPPTAADDSVAVTVSVVAPEVMNRGAPPTGPSGLSDPLIQPSVDPTEDLEAGGSAATPDAHVVLPKRMKLIKVSFTIPPSWEPGKQVPVRTQDGTRVKVAVPDDATPGQQISVVVPVKITHINVTIPANWKGGKLNVTCKWGEKLAVRPPAGSTPGQSVSVKLPPEQTKSIQVLGGLGQAAKETGGLIGVLLLIVLYLLRCILVLVSLALTIVRTLLMWCCCLYLCFCKCEFVEAVDCCCVCSFILLM